VSPLHRNVLDGNTKTLFSLLRSAIIFQLRFPHVPPGTVVPGPNFEHWIKSATTGNLFLSVKPATLGDTFEII